MRILGEFGSWRSEDIGGAGPRLEDKSLEKTSIVCFLMIEDHGGEGTRLINMRSLTKTN